MTLGTAYSNFSKTPVSWSVCLQCRRSSVPCFRDANKIARRVMGDEWEYAGRKATASARVPFAYNANAANRRTTSDGWVLKMPRISVEPPQSGADANIFTTQTIW